LTEDQPVEDDEESLPEESSRSYLSWMRVLVRERAVYPKFTRDVKARIVAWVQEHKFLYIKTHELYCNRYKMQAGWAELSAELKVDTKHLKTFWDGLRTRFGKLTKKKSGEPAPTFSERDQWILDNLCFINTYITRKQGVSDMIRQRQPKPKVTSTPAQPDTCVTPQSTISTASIRRQPFKHYLQPFTSPRGTQPADFGDSFISKVVPIFPALFSSTRYFQKQKVCYIENFLCVYMYMNVCVDE
jgi:hypothetical protein